MKLIPGSGRFAGSSFAPLVPGLWEHPYLVRDFTRGLEGQAPLSETGHGYDVGRYNERRRSMADPWAAGVPPSQRRDIHIGIDIGGPVGTAVHAVADGTVHSSGYNAAALDYGHVVVTEHRLCGVDVWALHGHLSADSSVRWRPGDKVARGEVLGWLGGTHENGGWPPHVHFQLSLCRPETHDMPGVVADAQHASALQDYPDPRAVLGPLYEGDGLFE